jgi:ribosome-associated translation inhibitor RaiA
MRIDTNAINIALTPEQREYARTRLWIATRVAAGRVAWAGMWLTAPESAEQGTMIECRITAWLRGTGPVSVSQSAADTLAAIDLAAPRLEHAIRRHLPASRTRLRTPRARRTRTAPRQTQRGTGNIGYANDSYTSPLHILVGDPPGIRETVIYEGR